MKKRTGCLIVVFILLMSSPVWGLIFSPPIVDLKISPGASSEVEFTLINDSQDTSTYRLYVTGVRKTRQGRLVFPEAAENSSRSCAPFMELPEEVIVLEPFEGRTNIKCKISLPVGASGGYYAALMCELEPRQRSGKEGVFIPASLRMSCLLKVIARGVRADRRVKITSIIYRDKEKAFICTLKNGGNIHLKGGQGRLTIIKGRRIIDRLSFEAQGMIFPSGELEIAVPYKKTLPRGEYTLRASINYSGLKAVSKAIGFTSQSKVKGEPSATDALMVMLSPTSLKQCIPQRGVRTCGLKIKNEEQFPVLIKTSLLDLSSGQKGELKEMPSGEKDYSLAGIVRIEPREFIVTPGVQRTIKLTFSVPAQSAGGFYGRVLLDISSKGKYSLSGRKRVDLDLTVPQTTKEAARVEKAYLSLKKGSPQIEVEFFNVGNIALYPTLEGQIKNSSNQEIGRIEFDKYIVMPGERAYIRGNYQKKLPSGNYLIWGKVEYGQKKNLIILRKELEVP